MRIGVDATCWANQRGYGRFARELIGALVDLAPEHQFVCLGDRAAFNAFSLDRPNVERVEVGVATSPTLAAASDGARSVGDMLACTRALYRAKVRVFFSPSVYTYFPLVPGQRAVVTIHDAIAERFPELTLPSRRARLFWNAKVGLAVRQARLVLTVSEYAARDIARVIGVSPDRLRVSGEAPAAIYTPSAPAEVAAARLAHGVGSDPYFVYVGGFNPHKRLDAVIRAHADVVRRTPAGTAAPHLLLVGRISGDVFHGEGDRLRQLVAQEGTTELVHWAGFVPDEALRHLHSGATAVVLVSESEGFGLPAIEGAACGAPVIATTESPLPQLLDGGGIFVPPGHVEQIAAAMHTLLTDPAQRAALGAGARDAAERLSWPRAARATLDALMEAAG